MASPHNPHTPPSVSLETDSARKVVRVHFHGIVIPAELKTQVRLLQDEVQRLGPGFVLVTDLTGLESMDLDCVSHLTRLMDVCLAAGVAKVIRIIPDPAKDIGLNLLSQVHYRGRVPTAIFDSRADADKELARR